jgi:cytochrome b
MKVWDLPTRLFHWTLVVLVAFSWWSAENGAMDWHKRSGICVLILLVFRLVWGVVGGSTARFSNFVRPPAAVLAHLRRPHASAPAPGHNPLGAYSVLAMLLALCVQVATGLVAVDVDGEESGPLEHLVSFDQGRLAAEVHEVSFTIIQVLVVLHVLAIGYYRLRGRRLIAPMVTGRDPQLGPAGGGLVAAAPARAVAALVAALLLGWWVSAGAPLGR